MDLSFTRVAEHVIDRCRREVEGRLKARIRSLLLPLVRARYGLGEVGEGFQWGRNLEVANGVVSCGRFSYLGANFTCSGPLHVGDLCMISANVKVVGDDHRINDIGVPTRLNFAPNHLETVFEADCWVGEGAIIKQGIRLGRGCVVAAGAVVIRSVEPYSVVAGVPAAVKKQRFSPEQMVEHERQLF